MKPDGQSDTLKRGPLSGVRVIDFTTFLSGPYCTQILGDLGAEVIKIEPFDGDSSRSIPPHFVGDDSAYYLSTNRNKRSIALNLKIPAAVEVARSLIATADVVVENFRPGICKKLGLDGHGMRAQQPSLIWAAISGFGQEGPWRNNPAYDMIVQALSGVMSLTGEVDRPSVRLGIPAGDIIAGMYAAIAINAALADRARTGTGAMIDISMLDGQLSMLSYQGQYHLVSGTLPGPQAAQHDSIPTYRSFTAGDHRELVVTANTQRMWVELCNVLGLPDLPDRPEFKTGGDRLTNKDALWMLLEPAFLARDAAAWAAALSERGVPAALIKDVSEAIADARDYGRNMIVPLTHADGRAIEMVSTPIKIEGVTPPLAFPPTLSEDADTYLTESLGMDAAAIAELRRTGALLTVPGQAN
ncbi:CaiB/BaiF CoA transferase family protein [Novosphingobium sp. BL-52-GroH]|uniref:CaiB/BaiF CoA transferase family protein n=1 Tax=Novosphingobium sp. BL-52-GroH TaxID=3349877 RepID=UPI00384C875F